MAQSVQRLATGWTVRGSNTGGGKIFRTCPDRPWGPPSLVYNGYRVFPGGKERPGRDTDASPLLVQWSRKSRAIPLIALWVVQPVDSLNTCTRVHFTFFTCTICITLSSYFVLQQDITLWRILAQIHYKYTGLSEMIVGDLTTCHTQYT